MSGGHGPEETLHLEGFGESLRGQRAYAVATSHGHMQTFLKARMDALDAEVAFRGRKVLIYQHATAPLPRWLTRLGWDAVFHVRDVQDLKLALTFVQHMTKPGRVVWIGPEPGAGVLGAFGKIDNLSVLCIGERSPLDTNFWQAIFWPADAGVEDVEGACMARMGSAAGKVRSVLRELRASEVGLVWSSIGEADKRGALYWYDPADGAGAKPAIDTEETVEILRALANSLENGRG